MRVTGKGNLEMDALALLCTLHADGPSTLARLRAADCTTIERVAAESPERLAELMWTSAHAAARFQREAHNLIGRLGAEPGMVALDTATEPAPSRPQLLERVLSTWRERDAAEALPQVDELRPSRPSDVCALVPPAIALGAIDGIDGDASSALSRDGIGDLAALARCDALATARRTGLSYSRVVRLRALAKRAAVCATSAVQPVQPLQTVPALRTVPPVQAVLAVQAPPTDTSKLSPADAPADCVEPLVKFEREFVLQPLAHEVDAGGPFA